MQSAALDFDPIPQHAKQAQTRTLLDLVVTLADFGMSDDEIVSSATRLVNSGRVRLVGQFRGAHIQVMS